MAQYAEQKLVFMLELEGKYGIQPIVLPQKPNDMRRLLEYTYGTNIDSTSFNEFYSDLKRVLRELVERLQSNTSQA